VRAAVVVGSRGAVSARMEEAEEFDDDEALLTRRVLLLCVVWVVVVVVAGVGADEEDDDGPLPWTDWESSYDGGASTSSGTGIVCRWPA
jgi:hypothetical protein